MGEPEFSFILPAYNEAENLEAMAARLLAAGACLGGAFEIVFVNDGSDDGTEELLETLAQGEPRIRPVHFSRNFGHMAALTAGLEAARATGALICMDADGQHPPELIPEMVGLWRSGVDIVQMIRTRSAGEGFLKRLFSAGFYRVMNALSGIELPAGAADFRLLDRRAADALNGMPERTRFIRGLVSWVGFKIVYVPFDAPARMAGTAKWGFRRNLEFALSAITSFSERPLRLSFLLGTLLALLALCYGAFILWAFFSGYPVERGWSSLLLAVLILGAIQLISLGIASEYIARLYVEVKRRPVYVAKGPRAGQGGRHDG